MTYNHCHCAAKHNRITSESLYKNSKSFSYTIFLFIIMLEVKLDYKDTLDVIMHIPFYQCQYNIYIIL